MSFAIPSLPFYPSSSNSSSSRTGGTGGSGGGDRNSSGTGGGGGGSGSGTMNGSLSSGGGGGGGLGGAGNAISLSGIGSSSGGSGSNEAKAPRLQKVQSKSVFPIEKEHREELSTLRDYFKKNNKVREYSGHTAKVHSVDWNSDGRKLASGSFDKTVCIYSLDGYKLRIDNTLSGHTDSVDMLTWHNSNPDLLATASGDKTLRIWDARHQKCSSVYNTKGENINISWASTGHYIAAGSKDDLLTVIDIRTGGTMLEHQFKFEVNEITFDPQANYLLLTNAEGSICIYDFPKFELRNNIKAHTANCICIEFHPYGDYFAVGGADAIVSLWTAETLACVRTFTRLDWPVRALSFNHNGSLLASASEDLIIDIAHVETGAKVLQIPVEAPTFTCAFHPTKNILAYACDDKNKYDRDRDSGILKLFGLPND